MNITEANAANVVLRQLVHREREASGSSPENVIEAAALLADRANKALHAGMTGAQVRERLT